MGEWYDGFRQQCPSNAAYRRHLRHGETPCRACKRVHAEKISVTRRSKTNQGQRYSVKMDAWLPDTPLRWLDNSPESLELGVQAGVIHRSFTDWLNRIDNPKTKRRYFTSVIRFMIFEPDPQHWTDRRYVEFKSHLQDLSPRSKKATIVSIASPVFNYINFRASQAHCASDTTTTMTY
jgi:hypothetical protein